MMSKGKPITNSQNAWGKDQWHNDLTGTLDGDKKEEGRRGDETGFQTPSLASTFSFMPCDDALHYFIPGAFGIHMISHMSRMSHTCAANSSCMYPHPYPTALYLIERIDQAGDGWYSDCADDLHLCDFIRVACMQTTCCMSISGRQPRGGDQVLEWLLEEGTFDCVESNVPNVVEEFCMAHSAAIGQRLLVRIEGLEWRVHLP